jgi:hypothetical protein
MRIRGFVSIDKAEKEGSLFNLRDEIGIIGDWVLDKDTGTIVKKERYYVPGPVVGVNTGRKGVSLSDIEHLPPFSEPPQGEGAPNPKDGDLSELWTEAKTLDSLWHEARNHKCGIFVWSKCQDTKHCGTRVISRVPCKREWCPYCGREQSYFHLIYYYKMLNYALIMFNKNGGKIGYLVVTTTPELQEQFLEDPDKMHKFRADVKDYLKDELGYKYGIWRWHFAGDDGRTWYPHLNILLPEGYMDEKKLNRFKRWIQRKYGVKVVNYEWTEDLGKLNHWVRYIARPTWNLQNEADPEKFKGMRKFGIWGNKHFKEGIGLTEEEAFFLALTIVVALEDLKKALRELETEKLEKLKNLERLLKHMLDGEDLVIPKTDQVERDLTLVLHLLRLGRCVRCGGKVKWDFAGFSGWGVLQGLRAGELHRIGWNTWIYVPKEAPPPDDEEVLEEE